MTEHVHEWYAFESDFITTNILCRHGCKMPFSEALAMLNAAERFVAFMDEYYSIRGKVEPEAFDTEEDRILKAIYANILEGKDE